MFIPHRLHPQYVYRLPILSWLKDHFEMLHYYKRIVESIRRIHAEGAAQEGTY